MIKYDCPLISGVYLVSFAKKRSQGLFLQVMPKTFANLCSIIQCTSTIACRW